MARINSHGVEAENNKFFYRNMARGATIDTLR
jgi:hypothetical protein